MIRVFIGGSRRVTVLRQDVRRRLDTIRDKQFHVILGDANGIDKAVQTYFHSMDYRNVEIFCTGSTCRNNVGDWPVRTIETEKKRRDFSFYAAKDRAMAVEATYGLMLWDGESVGTLMNVYRLVMQSKKVVVFLDPERQFFELRDESDWKKFVSRCSQQLRSRIDEEASAENELHRHSAQSDLF